MKKPMVIPVWLTVCCFAGASGAQQLDELAVDVAPTLEETAAALETATGLQDIRREGMLVFTTPFTVPDGFGDGPFDPNEVDPLAFGHRPTLQGNGTLLRVNGLDAQSCNECHTIVKHSTLPPTLGIGGIGGMVQNAIIMPSLIDVADSADDRVGYALGHDPDLPLEPDGVADYNGRFANPPFLFGGGGVELLAKEMTVDLQWLLEVARLSPRGTVVALVTHGVNFGAVVSRGGGEVELLAEGIGLESDETPEDVLVVRPFGRKGENFTMRDFDRGAMQFHFGIQPVEVVGAGVDEDGDGVTDEVSIDEMTVLHVFDVTNPRPFIEPLDPAAERGAQLFEKLGCVSCHRPVLETRNRYLPLAFPEVPNDPKANVYGFIDLVQVGFDPSPNGGVYVPLFADLKRHDMGPRLREDFERGEIPNTDFTTARLWGIADTAPYIHDGRATTLRKAIELHGGEARPARDAFVALPHEEQAYLIGFLEKLRTPDNPNEELLLP